MPYYQEIANKTSHLDFIRNPDVQEFLQKCEYLVPPDKSQIEKLDQLFKPPPRLLNPHLLPELVFASDGSYYEVELDDQIPHTRVGFLKIGAVLLSLKEMNGLFDGTFVDPFRLATLQDNHTALTFVLPGANVRLQGKESVRDSFRAALDSQLLDKRARFIENDYRTSLRSTLFYLAYHRAGELQSADPFHLKIFKCPTCENGPIEVEDKEEQQFCPYCKAEVYPTDCLRIWEYITDFQSSQAALGVLMYVLEHLLMVHYIRLIENKALLALPQIAFFIDGPLAIFGNSSWLHLSILRYIYRVNQKLQNHHQPPLLIIGLQKTGQVADYVRLIENFLPADRLFAIDDEYRYKYIIVNRERSHRGFGAETYYGQDFIFKTRQGRTFVFALPYPFASKEIVGESFVKQKTQWEKYSNLPLAVELIERLQTELFKNAVIPIALAHRYTAISLQPGGRVLEVLTMRALA
jgi:hypothetical protein